MVQTPLSSLMQSLKSEDTTPAQHSHTKGACGAPAPMRSSGSNARRSPNTIPTSHKPKRRYCVVVPLTSTHSTVRVRTPSPQDVLHEVHSDTRNAKRWHGKYKQGNTLCCRTSNKSSQKLSRTTCKSTARAPQPKPMVSIATTATVSAGSKGTNSRASPAQHLFVVQQADYGPGHVGA
jgi:hypothetical protein